MPWRTLHYFLLTLSLMLRHWKGTSDKCCWCCCCCRNWGETQVLMCENESIPMEIKQGDSYSSRIESRILTGRLVIVERDETREMIELRFYPRNWLLGRAEANWIGNLPCRQHTRLHISATFLLFLVLLSCPFPEVIIIKINIVLMKVSSKLTLWKYSLVMTKLEAWTDLRKMLQEICDH